MLTAKQTNYTSLLTQTASSLVPHTALLTPTPGVRRPTHKFSYSHVDGHRHVCAHASTDYCANSSAVEKHLEKNVCRNASFKWFFFFFCGFLSLCVSEVSPGQLRKALLAWIEKSQLTRVVNHRNIKFIICGECNSQKYSKWRNQQFPYLHIDIFQRYYIQTFHKWNVRYNLWK